MHISIFLKIFKADTSPPLNYLRHLQYILVSLHRCFNPDIVSFCHMNNNCYISNIQLIVENTKWLFIF